MKNILSISAVGLLVGVCAFLGQDKTSLNLAFTQTFARKSDYASPKYQVIGLADAIQFFYKTNVIFLDVRETNYFLNGHIAGAIDGGQGQFLSDAALLKIIGQFRSCVIYCDNPGCVLADERANSLSQLGATNLLVYSGGWEEWEACHLPATIQNDNHL